VPNPWSSWDLSDGSRRPLMWPHGELTSYCHSSCHGQPSDVGGGFAGMGQWECGRCAGAAGAVVPTMSRVLPDNLADYLVQHTG
jgi:hypothetical protein